MGNVALFYRDFGFGSSPGLIRLGRFSRFSRFSRLDSGVEAYVVPGSLT